MKKYRFNFWVIRHRVWFVLWFSGLLLSGFTYAQEDAEADPAGDERDEESAKKAATGEEEEEVQQLVDFTKGQGMEYTKGKWPMGPAGIIGVKNAGNVGNQVRVIKVLPGSPAEGKVLPGDVVLGMGGKKFVMGGDINWLAGNAIIEAESDAGKGLLKLDVWRDRNWIKRAGPADMTKVDVDQVMKEMDKVSDDDLYAWQDEKTKTKIIKNISFEKYPIDGFYTNIVLKLEVLGTYSDDSPWNCPVVAKIREKAWKVCANRINAQMNAKMSAYTVHGQGCWPDAVALVASGKPEYIDLVKRWVHSRKLEQDINKKISPINFQASKSWQFGFDPLEMAIYYDATGDKAVLPAVRLAAIRTAMNQSGGGAWGHGGTGGDAEGRLHWSLGGYGAVNNAGGRCFMLLAMAKKIGIEDPEINAALVRSSRFFGTFVDKGSMPYGYHGPVLKFDDECGRNYGVTYAFYLLGRKYEAKYFAMNSANAAFEGRGKGHGSKTLWYYTPWSANVCGPELIKAYMRNMRYYYTLARFHDGTFCFMHNTGLGDYGMRNAEATFALYYSYPLKQTIISGKDVDPDCWMTDKEVKEVLVSARPKIFDPVLLQRGGKPWKERSTDEVIDLLDHFFPRMRLDVAKEVARRYTSGEKDVVDKLLPLLASKSARMRDGACEALSLCGKDAVLANMSKVVALLKDDAEVVRMKAAATIGKVTQPGDKTRELELLKCINDDFLGLTADNGNINTAVKAVLLASAQKGRTSLLTTTPFKAGYDEDLVRGALERIVVMNPGGTMPNTWDRETLLKIAGPVVFSAEDPQNHEKMWGGQRQVQARELLKKHGYKEGYDPMTGFIRGWSGRDRTSRQNRNYGSISGSLTNELGCLRPYIDDLYLLLQQQPTLKLGGGMPLSELITKVEADTTAKPFPSIAVDVDKMFQAELASAGGAAEQLKRCRAELANFDKKNYFYKMSAMSHLVKTLGVKALDEIIPFFAHEQWRLVDHALTLSVDLAKQGAGPQLVEICNTFLADKSGPRAKKKAIALLNTLVDAGFAPALTTAKQALKHDDPAVRRVAIQAVFKLGGDSELNTVLAFLSSSAKANEDFDGAERALLSRKNEPAHVQRVSVAAIALLPRSEPPVRRSLAWVLGQFGGSQNLAAIANAVKTSKDEKDTLEMVRALAFSPDKAATKTMTALLKESKTISNAVSEMAIHRMVGQSKTNGVSEAERIVIARQILTVKYDPQMISYLGQIYSPVSMELLYEVMKNAGGASTELAARTILDCAENFGKPSKADSKRIGEILASVVEYIEMAHLRGGLQAHWHHKWSHVVYKQWQERQIRAGKILLKFANPESDAKNIDDTILDI